MSVLMYSREKEEGTGNAEETEGEETGVDVCLSLLGRRGKRDGQTHLGSFSLDTNGGYLSRECLLDCYS